ncbi:MAG: BTAD domain-containing putative transcriptional regulator [Desulfobacterales bacterium]
MGGLILLSESLDRLPEEARDQYLSKHLSEQFTMEVFQYFGEEIFSFQSGLVQDFLVRSAIFEVLEPALIREFAGIENAGDILQDLSRRNLFVQSVYDTQRGWLFRYHQLFRDFLKSKFETKIDKKEKAFLFFKAGSLLEQKGDLEESVKFFLEAKAYPEAGSIIERIGLDLFKVGRTGDLAQFLESLPEDMVKKNPWLLFYHSMTRRFTGIRQNMLSFQKSITLFKEQGVVRGHILSLAYLIEASIIRGHYLIPLDLLIEQGETLLKALNRDSYSYERAVFWSQTAYAHMYSGNPKKGFRASQNAYLTAKDLGNVTLQVNALIHAVGNLSVLGEFSLADKICAKLDKLIGQSVYPELRIFYHIHYSQLLTCRGDFENSRKLIFMCRQEVEERGLIFLYPIALIIDLFLKVYTEKYAEAEEIGNHLLSIALSMENTFLYGITSVWMGVSYYQEGNLQKAKQIMESCQQVLSSDEARAEYILGFIRNMISLIRYHFGEYGSAEKEIQENLKYLADIPSPLLIVDAHFTIALIKWKSGQAGQAAAHLHAGFKIAEIRRYVHFMGLNRSDLVKICTLAIELDVREAVDYATHLLSTRFADQAGPEIERLSHHSKAKIRNRAKEIQRTIRRTNAPRIRIETLGAFRVFRDDSLIKEKEWQGSRPRLLLKNVIARGCRGVLQDIIIEDLWPEGRPKASERNFKVTLHRLRKALEPNLDKTLGSSYIQLKDKSIVLDKELCHVDADEFEFLYDKGRIKEKNGDVKEALSRYLAAARLYQGDFLKEDLYAPWAHIKREELRLKYVDLLYRTAQLYENSGAATKAIACYKKVVQSESVSEKAYQRLMTLYSNRGMRSAALKIYEECNQALKTRLDTEPDEMTTAIYKKILET